MTRTDPPVSNAVILMAGMGSRLRSKGNDVPKPLFPLLGKPLVAYTLEALARAGLKNVYAITGYESEIVAERVSEFAPQTLKMNFVYNAEWRKQNGVSVLAAAPFLSTPFLLMMSDHLFDDAIIETLIHGPKANYLNVAVDRKLRSIFDLEDAMKLQTNGEKITAIGKTLSEFDAIDTGLFLCDPKFFRYLEEARTDGDCGLADGVRLAARAKKVRAVDVGKAWWQDVDTPEMLAEAERRFGSPSKQRKLRRTRHRDSGENKTAESDREPKV